MSASPVAPFNCNYTSHVPDLLQKLQCTIAVTTYQAGKLLFLSAKDAHSLIQLPRTFDKPMGIAAHPDRDTLALACKEEVIVFANSPDLARHYPKSPGTYDAMYMPRMTYHTGGLDVHDLTYDKNGHLYAVNTLFSCIVRIDEHYNFTPVWKPPFVDALVSEDRCHLNGLAMENGTPRYVTAFNQGNSYQSWRENVTQTGIVMDMTDNRIVAKGLAMPHTPRIFNGELYVLLSAKGELVRIGTETGEVEVVGSFGGFVRGMSLHKDYLFIGLSRLRKNSSTFAHLDFSEEANEAGVVIFHLPTRSVAGKISWQTSVDELYDVHILPDKLRPNILNTTTPHYKQAVMTPGATFWAAPKPPDLGK